MKALVEAHANSDRRVERASASRVAVPPTTLQIARLRAPLDLASRRAARVSAVSPDCVMTMVNVRPSTIGLR